jgi:hypothetical protein
LGRGRRSAPSPPSPLTARCAARTLGSCPSLGLTCKFLPWKFNLTRIPVPACSNHQTSTGTVVFPIQPSAKIYHHFDHQDSEFKACRLGRLCQRAAHGINPSAGRFGLSVPPAVPDNLARGYNHVNR